MSGSHIVVVCVDECLIEHVSLQFVPFFGEVYAVRPKQILVLPLVCRMVPATGGEGRVVTPKPGHYLEPAFTPSIANSSDSAGAGARVSSRR